MLRFFGCGCSGIREFESGILLQNEPELVNLSCLVISYKPRESVVGGLHMVLWKEDI